MGILGALFVTLFSGFASFFVQFLGRKLSIGAAAVAAVSVLFTALMLLLRSTIGSVIANPGNGLFAMGLGMVFPPNASICMGAISAVWAGCVLYKWQKTALDMFMKA